MTSLVFGVTLALVFLPLAWSFLAPLPLAWRRVSREDSRAAFRIAFLFARRLSGWSCTHL
ncbi:hypothetical protein [Deinococcus peraridilitoris]|uniref:hypothetical protein n=1 Tax=Deinococcus peraridilitoris TaxID=432329 RepID=UPI00145F5DF6|nr:hypothetical protein [Deinococcus peraridilitoris]